MDQIIFFFSTLGVFNGVLLSLYLFLFAKHRSLSKILLGALILALSIRLGKSIFLYFDRSTHKTILQIGLSGCLFIGPLLYYYLNSVLHEVKQMPTRWMQSLLILAVVIAIAGTWRPYHIYPDFWNTYMVPSIYSIWFVSVLSSGRAMAPLLIKCISRTELLASVEKWLCAIYLGNVIIAASYFMAFFGFSILYYISGPLVFTLFLYLLVFGYFNKGWFDMEQKPSFEKYNNRRISPAQVRAHREKLETLMQVDKVYKRTDLKLKDLAQLMNMTTHQLSQLLNDNLNHSFKLYINKHRIAEACKLIHTSHHLSLEGIGYEVGFRSKSTFFTTFKSQMQMTPAQYKEQLRAKTA